MNTSPLQFRGSNDTVQVIQGMRRVYMRPGPEFTGVRINDGAIQEMTFGQGAEALDMGQSGMRINIVPKSGGNDEVLRAYGLDAEGIVEQVSARLRTRA